MKETVKLGIVLFIFAAISAGVLAVTNNITAPIIAEYERQASFAAFADMFEDADDFQEIDEDLLKEINSEYGGIIEAHEALKGSEVIGYALKTLSGGYGGEITTIAGIRMDGTFAGIKVVSNSETPNLGTVITENHFSDSFIGKTVAEALKAVASPSADNEVQLLSGATASTGGVVTGVNNAREAFIKFLSDGSIELPEDEDPMEALFEDAEEFREIDGTKLSEVIASHSGVKEVYEAVAGDNVIGYIFVTEARGYSDAPTEATFYTGINLEGVITGMRVGENTETPGLGTQIEEEAFTSLFEGKSVTEELKAVGSASADNEIDVISNATESSDGAVAGVNKAIRAYVEFFAN